MKKLLSAIVAIVVLLGLATNVKAASMVANKSSFEVGDTVTLTVNVKDTDAVGIWLKYNPTVVEYVNATSPIGDIYPTAANGVVKIGGASNTAKNANVTFTFKAIAKGTADFTVERFDVEGDTTPTPVSYEVVEKTDDSEENNNGAGTDSKDEENKDDKTTTTDKKVDDQGKVIKTLPKTGTSYVGVAGLVLAVVGTVVIARKINK